MKRLTFAIATMVAVASMSVTGVSHAESYIGLYLDDARTTWCATGTPVYSVDMWVWAIIDEPDEAIWAYGFDVSLSPNVEAIDWALNPSTILEICDPKGPCPPPHHGVFTTCLRGWTWLQKCTLVVSTPDPGMVTLAPYSETGVISLTDCENTTHLPIVVSPSVYLNYDPSSGVCGSPVPVLPATWGAIKAMYRE